MSNRHFPNFAYDALSFVDSAKLVSDPLYGARSLPAAHPRT